MAEPRYVVMNENTLGYIDSGRPDLLCILHGSVLKGGHNWVNGPVYLSPSDAIRDASAEDFREYRVCSPPGFAR